MWVLEFPLIFSRKYSAIKMDSQMKAYAFRLTELEFEIIYLFHYDWDFDAALIGENTIYETAEATRSCATDASQEDLSDPSSFPGPSDDDGDDDNDDRPNGGAAYDDRHVGNNDNENMAARNDKSDNGDNGDNNDGDGGDDGGDDESDDDVDFDEGRECFCNPCVITNGQSFLGNAVPPYNRNAELRKKRYKIFRQMLDKRQAWIQPLYLRRKARVFSRPENTVLYTIRECMLRCVVDLVRSLFPNQPGRPYGA